MRRPERERFWWQLLRLDLIGIALIAGFILGVLWMLHG